MASKWPAQIILKPDWIADTHGGRASRVDFLLKKERVVVEVKKTRADHSVKDIGDELIIDIRRYEQHPGCDKLICSGASES